MAKLYKDKKTTDRQMLKWAKDSLDKPTYTAIKNSYRKYRFLQLLLPVVYAIAIAVLCIPFKDHSLHISHIGAAGLIIVFILWSLITRRFFGKTWFLFVKLFKDNSRPKSIIHEISSHTHDK